MSRKVHLLTRSALATLFLTLVILLASCEKKESAQEEAAEGKPPVAGETALAPPLTDANIAAIVLTANKMGVENAQMALGRTTNPAVKAFANQMVADHTSAIKQATDLAAKLGLKAEEDKNSRELEEKSDATRKEISESKGAAFDRAYVDNEVAFHQACLDMINKMLIPGATNAELKALLENARPGFEAHLDHARHVQASLPG